MKKRIHSVIILLVLAILSACGTNTTATPTTVPAQPTVAVAEPTAVPTTVSTDAATRTIETIYGTVEYPSSPQKIVALHPYILNGLLDVGVTPIGTIMVDGSTLLPEYATIAEGIEVVGRGREVNFEKIAQLKPDVIIGAQVPGVDFGYDNLSAIAPTIMLSMDVPADWQRIVLEAADLVGKKAEGEAVRDEYLATVQAIKTKYADVLNNSTWAIITSFESEVWDSYTQVSWAGVALLDAGFTLSASADNAEESANYYSYEELTLLNDSDYILLEADPFTNEPAGELNNMIALELWNTLPAVKAEHVYTIQNFYPVHYKQAKAMLQQIEADVLAKTAVS